MYIEAVGLIVQIKNSVYGPEFYRNLREEKPGYSFKYFFKFIALVSIVVALLVSIKLFPALKSFNDTLGSGAIINFPEELVITISNGKASTNVVEPYTFLFTADFKNAKNNIDNLLVIDTKTSFSTEHYIAYRTLAWLTIDSLIIGDEGSIRVIPLGTNIPNMTIDKTKISEWSKKVGNFAVGFVYFTPILFFIITFLSLTWLLIYILFGALVIWFMSKLAGWGLTYGKSYQIGLHAVTLPIIIFGFLNVIGWWHSFMISFTLLLIIACVFNLRRQTMMI